MTSSSNILTAGVKLFIQLSDSIQERYQSQIALPAALTPIFSQLQGLPLIRSQENLYKEGLAVVLSVDILVTF